VAFSFAVAIESPIVMILSASNALVRDRDSFLKLRNFTYFLNILLTIIMAIVVVPPFFKFLAERLIGLPESVSHRTYIACLILLPWPAAIGYRRFYQGILINSNETKKVTYGTIIRLFSIGFTAIVCFLYIKIEGAFIGAAALSVGVLMEAISSRLMTIKIVRDLLRNKDSRTNKARVLTYGYITKFFIPLALTTILTYSIIPTVTFFIGKSRYALESLAVLPVIYSLLNIFRSFGISFQEAGIALIGENFENFDRLKIFALIIGAFATGGLFLITFTPLSKFIFRNVFGLSSELTNFSIISARVLTLIPFLTVFVSLLRSILVMARNNRPITISTALELSIIILVLIIGIHIHDMIGIMAASFALLMGSMCSALYLLMPSYKVIKKRVWN